jgi:hypothetical protein
MHLPRSTSFEIKLKVMKRIFSDNPRLDRRRERGAALISTLLISALLLTAGGMLILTTSMTGTSTIDAAAEMQAYYGAEAGLQATLNVLRGGVMPNPVFAANPPGSVDPANRINFRRALTRATSNLAADPVSAKIRLSRWLAYNYTPAGSAYAERVAISQGYSQFTGTAYSIELSDPDATPLTRPPSRMIVESTGYGPRGAKKILTMIVSANGLNIDIPAPLVLRGHDNAIDNLVIQLGNSNAKTYSGVDNAGLEAQKPSLSVSGHDVATVQGAYADKPNTVVGNPAGTPHKFNVLDIPGNPGPAGQTLVQPPWFLKTADAARAFLVQAETLANSCAAPGDPCPKRGVVLDSLSGYAGSVGSPQFTVVKGNCNLDGGSGLLIVTGTLTFNGPGPNFKGVILVLGTGIIVKTGGGNRDIFGSVMVARFGDTGGFLAPTFNYGTGAGSSNLQYDSRAVLDAVVMAGANVLGIVEREPD